MRALLQFRFNFIGNISTEINSHSQVSAGSKTMSDYTSDATAN